MILTPIQTETFKRIFSFVSPCTSIFIAGGAAANLMKAGDIDVWFAKKNETAAKKFFNALPYHQLSNPEGNALYMSSGASVLGEGFIPSIPFPIQVITTLHESAQETIDSFDISTHAHAILSRDLRFVSGKESTTIFEAPQLVGKARSKTLARYIKICLRYGFTPDAKILKELTEDAYIATISNSITNPTLGLKQMAESISLSQAAQQYISYTKATTPPGAPTTQPMNLDKATKTYMEGLPQYTWHGQPVSKAKYNNLAALAATKHIGAKVASTPVVSQPVSTDEFYPFDDPPF